MIKKLRSLFDLTTLKFLLVGVINTLVGTGVMFLLYNAAGLRSLDAKEFSLLGLSITGLGYWISSASNYVVGSVVSYLLNKYFTFRSRKRSARELWLFIANITVCYFIAYGVAKPCAGWLYEWICSTFSLASSDAAKGNIAMLIGMCLFVGLNYLGQRFIVFRAASSDPDGDRG